MKRANKNKSSVQDNNTVVQTQNQTICTRTKKTSSTENAVHNIAEPLGKTANDNLSNKETINRHSKKDKASYKTNKDQSDSDSNDENEDDIQENNDKANNSDDEDCWNKYQVLNHPYVPLHTNEHVHLPFVLCLQAFSPLYRFNVHSILVPCLRALPRSNRAILQSTISFVTYRSQFECDPTLHTMCTY